jgi:pteridine reductase
MPELKELFGTDHPVALVTGSGAKRVGNVVARALAARGFQLVLHANRSAQEAEATVADVRRAGGQAIALTADLTNEAAARKLVDDAHQHFGRLDVLVNCAAIWRPIPLEKVTADEVRRNFEINTLATFVCAQSAGLKMAPQPTGGVIINIGDWAVARPYLNYAAYFPSKGAIPVLTRDLAVELASRNPRVRVNAILPGPVMLPPDLPQAEREKSIAGTLVKREGSPEHIAHAVLFLIENDFVTGVCLPVDGGRTIAS